MKLGVRAGETAMGVSSRNVVGNLSRAVSVAPGCRFVSEKKVYDQGVKQNAQLRQKSELFSKGTGATLFSVPAPAVLHPVRSWAAALLQASRISPAGARRMMLFSAGRSVIVNRSPFHSVRALEGRSGHDKQKNFFNPPPPPPPPNAPPPGTPPPRYLHGKLKIFTRSAITNPRVLPTREKFPGRAHLPVLPFDKPPWS